MNRSVEFLSLVLDSITGHISVIDRSGCICYVNRRWKTFGADNTCTINSNSWVGLNYIYECRKAADMGDDFGLKAVKGIESVIAGSRSEFGLEYPCHSIDEKRWFMMRVTHFCLNDEDYFVISHQDITKRKLAELQVKELASLDGLTNIPNRRTFDDFLHREWQRCMRLQKPICLAIFDLDYFKLLNDTYGHQAGDDCLIKFAQLLKTFARRPGDLCARYGGEEFALVFSGCSIEESKQRVDEFKHQLAKLKIHHSRNKADRYVTASIGLAECVPQRGETDDRIIELADNLLYQAKKSGRNQISFASCTHFNLF
ncbi:diguanylate cyclase [Vibrio sp. CAIM 722]|uniref:diguanylate cyclase n=1 Tax=Vibrio eleionomae TaxID=2653505 RepID=A0A7X4LLA7_9VIBR|nr:sensor domain-containing diguanylate cyclase [Vibrio eleionomae]MZI93676.1 diguanylate cyclase [Vibrio eleionomae]